MKLRRRLLVLLAALPLLSACKENKEEGDLPTPPISLPFGLQKAGNNVDTVVRIKKCHHYGFTLMFDYKENDQLDRARVRKLVGGHETDATGVVIEPGILTPVRLKISEISVAGERLVFEKESTPILSTWGADSFGKRIGEALLQPGIYRISLEALVEAPEYIGTPIYLRIGSDPKSTPSKRNCPNGKNL